MWQKSDDLIDVCTDVSMMSLEVRGAEGRRATVSVERYILEGSLVTKARDPACRGAYARYPMTTARRHDR